MIVDAGPLYAVVDESDEHHAACAELLETHPGPLVVPALVIAEAAHLVRTRLGTQAEVTLIADFAAANYFAEGVSPTDWLRIMELVSRYRDLPLGTTDASVVAAAERLGEVEIATTDRRHFHVVRPDHTTAFVLLP